MGSDFLAVAAERAASGEYAERMRTSTFFSQNSHTAGFWCAAAAVRLPDGFRQSPALTFPSQDPCSSLAWELLCDCEGWVLMVTQMMGSTSLLRSQWPSPKSFPAWELLPWTGQIELMPPCKAVPSSSLCLLSSMGTWIPSLTKVKCCGSFPALGTAMRSLRSATLNPASNSGFWAYTNLATALSSATEVKHYQLGDQMYSASCKVGDPGFPFQLRTLGEVWILLGNSAPSAGLHHSLALLGRKYL